MWILRFLTLNGGKCLTNEGPGPGSKGCGPVDVFLDDSDNWFYKSPEDGETVKPWLSESLKSLYFPPFFLESTLGISPAGVSGSNEFEDDLDG